MTTTPIKHLRESAKGLNIASDNLAVTIERINESLKQMNLGCEAWTQINLDLWLGYARVGERWGLAIRTPDGPMLFNEAKRSNRVLAVGFLTELFIAKIIPLTKGTEVAHA